MDSKTTPRTFNALEAQKTKRKRYNEGYRGNKFMTQEKQKAN